MESKFGMPKPFEVEIGNSIDDIDTPAPLINIDTMESNIRLLMQRLSHVNVRPHLKTVKSLHLASLLQQRGARGACVAKVSEAEILCQVVEDLLITTEIVGTPKVQRLVRLFWQCPTIKIVIDNYQAAKSINDAIAATVHKGQLGYLIDLNVGQNRTGIAPGEPALALARQLQDLPHLQLLGVQGYEGHLQHIYNPEDQRQQCLAAMEKLTGTAQLLRDNGFTIDIVTTGGSGTAEICASCPGVTEVQPGSFIFWDMDYDNAVGGQYGNALTIVSTVISRSSNELRAVVDAGLKSLSTDSGFAQPKGFPGMRYSPAGDEHGIIEWDNPQLNVQVGSRIQLIPSHIDTTVNLHHCYYAHRGGMIVDIWPIDARGKVQ